MLSFSALPCKCLSGTPPACPQGSPTDIAKTNPLFRLFREAPGTVSPHMQPVARSSAIVHETFDHYLPPFQRSQPRGPVHLAHLLFSVPSTVSDT